MNLAIIYASVHHKNTEKIIQAISERFPEIQLIDTTKAKLISLAKFDMIGIASGIYYGKFHKKLLDFITDNLPERKKVFLMYTCGSDNKRYEEDIKAFLAAKIASITGIFACKGYDTFGPFKFIGGLNKKHPDENDIDNAVKRDDLENLGITSSTFDLFDNETGEKLVYRTEEEPSFWTTAFSPSKHRNKSNITAEFNLNFKDEESAEKFISQIQDKTDIAKEYYWNNSLNKKNQQNVNVVMGADNKSVTITYGNKPPEANENKGKKEVSNE